jgi:hypothetical protein
MGRENMKMAAVALCLTGIAFAENYQAYDGPRLPRKELAVLEQLIRNSSNRGSVLVEYVDDQDLTHAFCHKKICGAIELLPGQHQITFHLVALFSGSHVQSKTIVVQAGKTYKIRLNTFGESIEFARKWEVDVFAK